MMAGVSPHHLKQGGATVCNLKQLAGPSIVISLLATNVREMEAKVKGNRTWQKALNKKTVLHSSTRQPCLIAGILSACST